MRIYQRRKQGARARHNSAIIPLPVEAPPRATQPLSETYPQLNGREIVLFLSRIDPKKGLELFFDAFARVWKNRPEAVRVIAGQGERAYMEELRGRPSVVANAERIFCTGHLTGEMKSAAFAVADVFVLPSASENFGIAAAESLAAGVPTIVSEEVALSDDIRRYDAGIVVKRDIRQLATAITDLLSNKEKAATLAANGRRLAEERYSPEAVGKALHDLYQKIIP